MGLKLTASEAEAHWRAATKYSQLCELGASFIEGTAPFFPIYFGEDVDEETHAHRADLAAINRAGLLTTCSQPGESNGEWHQRAFVDGFAPPDVADALHGLNHRTDLVTLVMPLDALWLNIPATREAGTPNLWTGRPVSFHDAGFSDAMNAELLSSVEGACVYVVVLDPEWGRNTLLWKALSQVTGELGAIAEL